MPETTKRQTRTDIRVPPGTVEVLENHVLAPHSDQVEEEGRTDANGWAANAAWEGMDPGPHAHHLRYDLTDPGGRAGAVWLFFELKEITSRPIHTIPDPLLRRRDVLSRIAQELYDALRATETVGVGA